MTIALHDCRKTVKVFFFSRTIIYSQSNNHVLCITYYIINDMLFAHTRRSISNAAQYSLWICEVVLQIHMSYGGSTYFPIFCIRA